MSKSNQRQAYGKTLVELGREDARIVALEADLGKSTMSTMFEQAFPERYFEMGIAEANMAGFAAGLAIAGKIPFIHSFAVFSTGRPYDQLRQSICIPKLTVRIIGTSSGLTDYADGATHQSVEDLALMAALPNMTVLAPCDSKELELAVRESMNIDGPVYIRIGRNDTDDLYPLDDYKIGRPTLLKDGRDVCLFSTGVIAGEVITAADMLQSEGISARVVHIPGIKPLCEQSVIDAADGVRAIVSCEEHSIYGGLGMRLCHIFRNDPRKKETVAIQDEFGQSARKWEELLEHYGLSSRYIVQAAKTALGI